MRPAERVSVTADGSALTAAPTQLAPAPPNEYVPWLDGLRALAILAVLLYHFVPALVPGGLLGVDIFFVISGYIISSMLVEELHLIGTIRLRKFYSRRARRLLPALLFVLSTVIFVTVVTGRASQIKDFRAQILGSLFYVVNWTFVVGKAGYFSSAVETPLKHFWSLAIEEQFYFFAPLFLLGLARYSRRVRAWHALFALTLSLLSVGLALYLYRHGADPSRVYYGTDTHAGGLLLGVGLGIWCHLPPPARSSPQRRSVEYEALVLLVIIVASLYVVRNGPRLYQGGIFAVDVFTAMLVRRLWSGQAPVLERLIGWGPCAALGRRSYSLYLVHWPVVALLAPNNTSVTMNTGRIALTVITAEVLHRGVENIFRAGRAQRPVVALSNRWAAALLPALVITIVIVSLAVVPVAKSLPTTLAAAKPVGCHPVGWPPTVLAPGPHVDVYGDSTAFVFALYGSVHSCELGNLIIGGDIRIGCGVVDDDALSQGRRLKRPVQCNRWSDRWAAHAAQDHPQVAVIMTGAWEMLDRLTPRGAVPFTSSKWSALVRSGLTTAVDAVKPSSGRIVLMPIPCYGAGGIGALPERADPARIRAFNAVLADVARSERVEVSAWRQFVCPSGTRLESIGNQPMWMPDKVHLTVPGALATWRWALANWGLTTS